MVECQIPRVFVFVVHWMQLLTRVEISLHGDTSDETQHQGVMCEQTERVFWRKIRVGYWLNFNIIFIFRLKREYVWILCISNRDKGAPFSRTAPFWRSVEKASPALHPEWEVVMNTFKPDNIYSVCPSSSGKFNVLNPHLLMLFGFWNPLLDIAFANCNF